MLLLHHIDLVISDIQMPHFSGIDLLEWVRKNQPVPVILMTGFSQALETKEAQENGADGFLAKPFFEADLHEILQKYTSAEPVPEARHDVNADFCKVSIEDFISDKETEYAVYIRISDSKFIKIAHKGGKISDDRIKTYKEKGINFVYIKKEDFSKVVKFNVRVAKIASGSPLIAPEKKINFVKHTGELILESAFVNGVNKELFLETKDFLEASMETLADDSQMFTILDVLSTHADFLYAHSLGVSVFSVMIGKVLGWQSSQVLFRLALGGLFHDIGKKEIPKEVLEKPRVFLSQFERTLVESHSTRGKEILESLPSIPSDVVMMAYQHHEDELGQGFPKRLGKREIHPLAKVVRVANIFCEYAVKCRPDVTPMTGDAAIATMEKMKSDSLDEEAFRALKRLFAEK
jgi:putative nucleotidyltransferase with HDIG domain